MGGLGNNAAHCCNVAVTQLVMAVIATNRDAYLHRQASSLTQQRVLPRRIQCATDHCVLIGASAAHQQREVVHRQQKSDRLTYNNEHTLHQTELLTPTVLLMVEEVGKHAWLVCCHGKLCVCATLQLQLQQGHCTSIHTSKVTAKQVAVSVHTALLTTPLVRQQVLCTATCHRWHLVQHGQGRVQAARQGGV